jgi:cell division protein FtsW (lipid II flippase)
MPYNYFVFSDGDIGRAAVELGLMGLIVLAFVIFGLLPRLARVARRFAHGLESDLALGIGALVLSSGVVILIGSPLSTTPHAIIWWFLFGALIRLWIQRAHEPDVPAPA